MSLTYNKMLRYPLGEERGACTKGESSGQTLQGHLAHQKPTTPPRTTIGP